MNQLTQKHSPDVQILSFSHSEDDDFTPPGAHPQSDHPPVSSSSVRMSTKQLARTFHQIASLLQGGMPLLSTLQALREQLQNHPSASVLQDMENRIAAGSSLAAAMTLYPNIFSQLQINLIHAGETSGTLETTLNSLADMLQQRHRLTARVKTALAYPAMMTLTALAVIFFLMTFVVPGIMNIFTEMNRTLPWPTLALISLCTALKKYGLILLLLLFAAIISLRFYVKTEHGKTHIHPLLIKTPFIGPLIMQRYMILLTQTLSVLLTAGIPILQAFHIIKNIIPNHLLKNALRQATEKIEKGASIAQALRETHLFPPLLLHTIALGEATGSLEKQLEQTARIRQEEFALTLQTLTALFEPAILLIMGFIIGFIVLATLLPIFEINQML